MIMENTPEEEERVKQEKAAENNVTYSTENTQNIAATVASNPDNPNAARDAARQMLNNRTTGQTVGAGTLADQMEAEFHADLAAAREEANARAARFPNQEKSDLASELANLGRALGASVESHEDGSEVTAKDTPRNPEHSVQKNSNSIV